MEAELVEEKDEGGGNVERVTTKYMTKYEKARVLGTRALQIRCVSLRPRGPALAFACLRLPPPSVLGPRPRPSASPPGPRPAPQGVCPLPVAPPLVTHRPNRSNLTRSCPSPPCLLSMNAPPMVDIGDETDPLKIAMKELQERKVPIIIRRYLPDGSYEDWKIKDLIIE